MRHALFRMRVRSGAQLLLGKRVLPARTPSQPQKRLGERLDADRLDVERAERDMVVDDRFASLAQQVVDAQGVGSDARVTAPEEVEKLGAVHVAIGSSEAIIPGALPTYECGGGCRVPVDHRNREVVWMRAAGALEYDCRLYGAQASRRKDFDEATIQVV